MMLNNIELDVKTKCIEKKVSQTEFAEKVGTSAPYVNKIINGKEQIVNNTFLPA